jgi:hypothetical protein
LRSGPAALFPHAVCRLAAERWQRHADIFFPKRDKTSDVIRCLIKKFTFAAALFNRTVLLPFIEELSMQSGKLFYAWTCLVLLACSGGGGTSDETDTGSVPAQQAGTAATVLAFNDLGMHCMDREFSVFSILPPFNVLNAQVLVRNDRGFPVVQSDVQLEVFYDAVTDPAGSINTYSAGKTDFWQYADTLFGLTLQAGQGLTGLYMPGDDPVVRGPQPMEFNPSLGWFSADGIPIAPEDDRGLTNPYPLLRVSARDRRTGNYLGQLDVVVPVASETDCQNCHATGEAAARRNDVTWAADGDREVQTKKNILILHDDLEGTDLTSKTPVLCAQCHYSRPLDLVGTGPTPEQQTQPEFSRVMHRYHSELRDAGGQPLFPTGAPVEQTCYQCHPGKVTQCQRGAMRTGGMDCNDCHGDMAAVGGANALLSGGSIDGNNDGKPRRPWLDLPRCQSCHTGDAIDHLEGPDLIYDGSNIRLRQSYRSGDPSASPLLAANLRFAENPDALYRNSKGHGGIACEACHGSTHAVWPNADPSANDNVAAQILQGHAGTVIECSACHRPGSLPLTTRGPHGLHNVNDARWIDEEHGEYYRRDRSGCKVCHGLDLTGTALAKMPIARTFRVEGRTVSYSKADRVRCDRCHGRPGL